MIQFFMDWSFDSISSACITSVIILVVLSLFFLIMGIRFSRLKEDKEVPTKGLMFACVLLVHTINNFVKNNLGERGRKLYSPYFIGVCAYIGLSNIASVFGLTPPFSNIGLALTLSLLAFVMFQFTGFRFQGFKKRIDGWLGPVKGISFLIFPISLIGEFTTPFSMGMRMFGNIFSGVLLCGVVLGATETLGAFVGSFVSTVGIGVLFHPIFDIFFGLLQMYIYFMLTTMFLKQNMD